MIFLQKQQNETLDEYITRLCKYKLISFDAISWQDIADMVSQEFDYTRSEIYYRRYAKKNVTHQIDDNTAQQNETDEDIKLKSLLVRLSDERIQVNALVRQLSREGTFKDIGREAANIVSQNKSLLSPKYPVKDVLLDDSGDIATLLISDWHYGMEFDNFVNKFNPEICKERVSNLLREVITICKSNRICYLNVVNLGDMIAGRIHLPIRLQSRYDVITQTMFVSEILAEFLSELAANFSFPIHYYSCTDNHSRLEPNKKDSLQTESLARITPWYLNTRLDNYPTICIHCDDNNFGDDIVDFKVFGHYVVGVHGDNDKAPTIISDLKNILRDDIDLVLMAHQHHFQANEDCHTLLIGNGSLMGTDEYAIKFRKSSYPQQTLILSDEVNVAKNIYRIIL